MIYLEPFRKQRKANGQNTYQSCCMFTMPHHTHQLDICFQVSPLWQKKTRSWFVQWYHQPLGWNFERAWNKCFCYRSTTSTWNVEFWWREWRFTLTIMQYTRIFCYELNAQTLHLVKCIWAHSQWWISKSVWQEQWIQVFNMTTLSISTMALLVCQSRHWQQL